MIADTFTQRGAPGSGSWGGSAMGASLVNVMDTLALAGAWSTLSYEMIILDRKITAR